MSVEKTKYLDIYNDWCITLSSWNDIFLARVFGKADTKVFDNLTGQLSRFRDSQNKPVGYICVISKKASVPDSDARKALAAGLSKLDLLAISVIIEKAQGFWGAAALGFMSAMQSLAKTDYPIKNVGTINEGAKWFTQVTRERAGWNYNEKQIALVVSKFVSDAELSRK